MRPSSWILGVCLAATLWSCGKGSDAPAGAAATASAEAPPTLGTVTPASGSGKSQTFTATYSSTGGAKQVISAFLLVERSVTGVKSCFIEYNSVGNSVNLMDDAGKWQATVRAGSGTPLANTQCSVDVAGVRSAADGNTLTVTFPVTFTPAYAGPKQIYLMASGAKAAVPWTAKGSWVVQ